MIRSPSCATDQRRRPSEITLRVRTASPPRLLSHQRRRRVRDRDQRRTGARPGVNRPFLSPACSRCRPGARSSSGRIRASASPSNRPSTTRQAFSPLQNADMTLHDIGALFSYDAFSILPWIALERFRFLQAGEAAAFTQNGRIELRWRLPMETPTASALRGTYHGLESPGRNRAPVAPRVRSRAKSRTSPSSNGKRLRRFSDIPAADDRSE